MTQSTRTRQFLPLALGAILIFATQPGLLQADPTTALQDFIDAPDPSFAWSDVNTITGPGYTANVLNMTSQTWLTPSQVNSPNWQNYVTVIKPANLTSHEALLFIDGGSIGGPAPTSVDPTLLSLAQSTGSEVIELSQVPNEPLTFAGQPPRTEDGIIAYTWEQYLTTGDENWPAQLPMTKAAVKAMDAVQAFANTPAGGNWSINDFVVSGGSKRGWTTWLTAAVDHRVAAIMPIVADTLNVQKAFANAYAAYGTWPSAIQDYVDAGIPNWFGTPQMNNLMQIVDPYSYLNKLTMPKYDINSAGDQFFTPDSSQFYFHNLLGTNYERYVPNTDHSLANSDAAQGLQAFYNAILHNDPLPQFSWYVDAGGTLHVHSDTAPLHVLLWQANDPTARDFRLETIGAAYTSITLTDLGGGNYVATVPHPVQGWTAYFVELDFASKGLFPFEFTTDVQIVGVPEPGTWVLMALGSLGLIAAARRTRA